MREGLVGVVLAVSAAAAAFTVHTVLRIAKPPDETAAVLGVLWLAMPYLAAAGLALLVRRHVPPLAVLLVALLAASIVGSYLFDTAASQQLAAETLARTTVLPGEDPDRGPAGTRHASAELGADIGGVFSILICVVLPPVQLVAVVLPTLIAYAITVGLGRRGHAPEGPPRR